MTASLRHAQRIRTFAVSAGIMLGMALATLAPQLGHAAEVKKTKRTLVEKIVALPEATVEQLQAAERVLIGKYQCEFGKAVQIDRHARNDGYFDLRLGQQSWTMKPVLSSTGAVRLEDVKGAALMIQILTKSMLMDPKRGQRLVDGCVHDTQRAAEEDLRRNPRPSVFGLNSDTPADGK
ncbi:MAG: hypothetical protein ACK4MG_13810 [Aquabacterium sp.]|uniref:hypothetical protein n=1 Tax=Aquabacterium sp. TaxID=1872578 RepID=UPI0025F90053|nr:hypothetical protein [uncultured Aquabacterium sp.]